MTAVVNGLTEWFQQPLSIFMTQLCLLTIVVLAKFTRYAFTGKVEPLSPKQDRVLIGTTMLGIMALASEFVRMAFTLTS